MSTFCTVNELGALLGQTIEDGEENYSETVIISVMNPCTLVLNLKSNTNEMFLLKQKKTLQVENHVSKRHWSQTLSS